MQRLGYGIKSGYDATNNIMKANGNILNTLYKNGVGLQIQGYLRSIFVHSCVLNLLPDTISYSVHSSKNKSYKYVVYRKNNIHFTIHKMPKNKAKSTKYTAALALNNDTMPQLFTKEKYYQLNYDGKNELELMFFGEVTSDNNIINKSLSNIHYIDINDTSLLLPQEFEVPHPTFSLKTVEVNNVLSTAQQIDENFNFSLLNNNMENIFRNHEKI